MKSHEAIQAALKQSSPKQVAADLGISLSLIYKWAQPQDALGSGSRNPLDRIATMYDSTGDTGIIQWLCHYAGGYFVRNPERTTKPPEHVMPATNEMVSQFATLLTSISQAADDNAITEKEAETIRHAWNELKSFAEEFVTCCEEGDFDPIRRANSHTPSSTATR